MDKLGYWADAAQRSEKIRESFRSFFKDVESKKTVIDENLDGTMKIPGAPPTVPSILVDRFRQKKKREKNVQNVGKQVIMHALVLIIIKKINEISII